MAVEKAQQEDIYLPHFCVHDLRRTGSTLLHKAGFNTDWIEKCLAHEQRGVRAVYTTLNTLTSAAKCCKTGQIWSTDT